jgi:hypothetical protein
MPWAFILKLLPAIGAIVAVLLLLAATYHAGGEGPRRELAQVKQADADFKAQLKHEGEIAAQQAKETDERHTAQLQEVQDANVKVMAELQDAQRSGATYAASLRHYTDCFNSGACAVSKGTDDPGVAGRGPADALAPAQCQVALRDLSEQCAQTTEMFVACRAGWKAATQ